MRQWQSEFRKVLFSKEVADKLFTSDALGNRLRVDWGEPDEDDFYTPTITVDYDDNIALRVMDEIEAEAKA